MTIDWVFLDVGGILFSDDSYFTSLFEAIVEAAPDVARAGYEQRLRALRAGQSEPFTEALVEAFVADRSRHAGVRAEADARWERRGYGPGDLYPEVPGALRTLAARYRIACITNHFSWVRDRARDAGFSSLVDVWAISAEVGADKPDPALFRHALREARTEPGRVAMVGDRLDRDIAPTKALGMRTVWMLRNEAPEEPTPEQLALPDAVVRTLDEVPGAIEDW